MRQRIIPILIGVLAAVLIPRAWSVSAQSNGATKAAPKAVPKPAQSAHDFVDHFYELYLSKLVDDDGNPSAYDAIESQRLLFSPVLRRALKAEFDAEDESPDDEIIGLDFDPFLNAQDPCDEYEVGDATRRGATLWVAIYGICDGKKHDRPDVYAEVVPMSSGWVFVNFHYPDGGDLLSILKSFRAQRRKSAKDTPGLTKS